MKGNKKHKGKKINEVKSVRNKSVTYYLIERVNKNDNSNLQKKKMRRKKAKKEERQ